MTVCSSPTLDWTETFIEVVLVRTDLVRWKAHECPLQPTSAGQRKWHEICSKPDIKHSGLRPGGLRTGLLDLGLTSRDINEHEPKKSIGFQNLEDNAKRNSF